MGNMAKINPDVQYMKKALRLAAFGAGMTSPNPLVGAVIVKQGAIVGEGYHQVLGGPHAEVNAISAAGAAAAWRDSLCDTRAMQSPRADPAVYQSHH